MHIFAAFFMTAQATSVMSMRPTFVFPTTYRDDSIDLRTRHEANCDAIYIAINQSVLPKFMTQSKTHCHLWVAQTDSGMINAGRRELIA